jgi:hypothetical protein
MIHCPDGSAKFDDPGVSVRDYTSPVDIQIKIFDQSISFFNPGKLYGDLTIEKLKRDDYQSRTRNRLIAEAFYLTRDIEKYGSGFIRVRNSTLLKLKRPGSCNHSPSMGRKTDDSLPGWVGEI